MKMLKRWTVVTIGLFLMACGDNSSSDTANNTSTETIKSQTLVNDAAPVLDNTPKNMVKKEEQCELAMGWASWEPYQYRARDGKETGLDLEIARATEAALGCKINFKEGDWAELLNQLKEGSLDSVTSAAMTENRREYAYFSEPYRSESFAIYVREDEFDKYSGQSIRALLDSGVRVGAVSGYSYGITIADYETNDKYQKQFIYNEISEENFGMLFDLKLDIVLEDPFVGSDMIRRKGWNDKVSKLPLVIHSGDVHFMFSKKSVSDEMVQKMNDALAKLKADGSYRRLIELYGG